MLEKLLTLVVGVTVVGHFLFRPQLRRIGQRVDRFVTWMAVAAVVTWIGQLGYFLLNR